jgi:hypothetical protein
MLLLKEAVEKVNQHFSSTPPSKWVLDQPTQDDIQHILREGTEVSKFDPLRLRETMITDLQEGRAQLLCRRCQYGKVLVIVHPEWKHSIPWKLFGQIFRAFSKLPTKGWRVVLFANPTLRQYDSQTPGPAHVNGGYAYPGQPQSIVIYRLEECARVLVHELLHAAGTDNMNHDETLRETLTESYAELFLIAIQANGSMRKANKLWRIQAQWIVDQEARLINEFNVRDTSSYAYRYTVARRPVLEGWGFTFPSATAPSTSLRFTAPALTQ